MDFWYVCVRLLVDATVTDPYRTALACLRHLEHALDRLLSLHHVPWVHW